MVCFWLSLFLIIGSMIASLLLPAPIPLMYDILVLIGMLVGISFIFSNLGPYRPKKQMNGYVRIQQILLKIERVKKWSH